MRMSDAPKEGKAGAEAEPEAAHSDLYYALVGGGIVVGIGFPWFLIHELKHDVETRIFAEDHLPWLVQWLEGLVALPAPYVDNEFAGEERFDSGALRGVPVIHFISMEALVSTRVVAWVAMVLSRVDCGGAVPNFR